MRNKDNRKLSLNKQTLANLESNEMENLRGGTIYVSTDCIHIGDSYACSVLTGTVDDSNPLPAKIRITTIITAPF